MYEKSVNFTSCSCIGHESPSNLHGDKDPDCRIRCHDGWYANRPRGLRRQAAPTSADAPGPMAAAPTLAPTEVSRR